MRVNLYKNVITSSEGREAIISKTTQDGFSDTEKKYVRLCSDVFDTSAPVAHAIFFD